MYFIDVQGTLISDVDKSPLPGSKEFIARLSENQTPFMVITNNTKEASKDFYDFLQNQGFDFPYANYLDPLMLLEDRVSKGSVAAYGAQKFLDVLEKMGYTFDYIKPKTVLIAIKEDFTNEEYAQMIEFILGGAKLVGMHETSLYAKNAKRYPGVGALLKMLSFATSCSYDVVGKPSTAFYNEALARLREQDQHANFKDITIISDDVKGDLCGAKEMGMRCQFVTSGKYKSAEEILPFIEPHLRPDGVFKDMQEILEKL
ncbi:MAG: HAD-IIA family hydrolase [Sulfurimonadaceae bacterium]|jgi:NagD protein|nr:HAD-IIA family hydrolase [Sulfurimonadaceae bacterium]